jgi:hypothetical protein
MRHHRHALFLAIVAAGLLGCSKADSSAAASTATPGSATSYEIVTIERPESVDAYHKTYKAMYDMCAELRKTLKMPPPAPMLQPPANYISQRTTHVSDGKAYLTKEEHFIYKVAEIEERNPSCATSLESTSNTQLIRDGKMYNSSVDPEGKRESAPPDEWFLPRDKESDIYPERKMVKGHAVKCMHVPAATKGMLTELCVADLNPGTLTDIIGKPIVIASRVSIVQDMMGIIVTEPVSVRVNQPIDKAIFDAAAAP